MEWSQMGWVCSNGHEYVYKVRWLELGEDVSVGVDVGVGVGVGVDVGVDKGVSVSKKVSGDVDVKVVDEE